MNNKNKTNGFTLLELMVTLAVAAVLITSGVPAFGHFVQRNRQTTATNALVSALALARSEAVKRNLTVGVCASSDRTTCTGTWDQGWLVYTTDAGGHVQSLRSRGPLDGNLTLTAKQSGGAPFSKVTFKASGLADTDGLFTLCDSRGAELARAVKVSTSGGAEASPQPGYAVNGKTPLTCP